MPVRHLPAYLLFSLGLFPAALSAQSISAGAGSAEWFQSLLNLPAVLRSNLPAPSLTPTCSISPLRDIQEPDALAFENGADANGGIDLAGLQPAMARALERFRHLVLAVGGSFDLKSAYRPPAYQEHLQEVWYKWMVIRRNHEPACQKLKAEVAEEFSRHRLMESQVPVSSSDHTRGLAFDAAVILPRFARLQRRRVSVDRLAVLAGLTRPDIRRDPVHFKLVLGRGGQHD